MKLNIGVNMKYESIEQMLLDLKYERPDSYHGSEYHGYIGVISRARDSDCMIRSNFEIACDLLDYDSNRPIGDDVVMACASHWAYGWVNILYVSIKCADKLNIAMKIFNDLNNYPALDEDHYYELEREELNGLIECNQDAFNDEFAKYLGKASLNQAEKMFIRYNVEESSSYYGHEDAWFNLNTNCMLRAVEYVRDNRLACDSIEMKNLLDQLEFALEFEKLAA